MKRVIQSLLFCLAFAAPLFAQNGNYDVVLAGGRVLDPETGLDAIRDVGVRDGVLTWISDSPLEGGVRLDVSGLIVAPGFIDLHAHGQSNRANEFQAHDGVTTALELEAGYGRIAEWIASRTGHARLNFGASVSHGEMRLYAIPEYAERLKALGSDVTEERLQREFRDGLYKDLPEEATEALYRLFEKGLEEGGLGIGMPHQYYPGASRREIFRVFQFASAKKVPIFTHVRSVGADAMQEVLADAAASGASLPPRRPAARSRAHR
jgi:N-acyl-D-aspartate/D-glutamate deacylase